MLKKDDFDGLSQFDGFVGLNEDVKGMVIRVLKKKMRGICFVFVYSYDEEDDSTLDWNVHFVTRSRSNKCSSYIFKVLFPWL